MMANVWQRWWRWLAAAMNRESRTSVDWWRQLREKAVAQIPADQRQRVTYDPYPPQPQPKARFRSYMTAQDAFGRWLREPIDTEGYAEENMSWDSDEARVVWANRLLRGHWLANINLRRRLDEADTLKLLRSQQREWEDRE